MKKIIAPFVLDILVATAGVYIAVSQLRLASAPLFEQF